MERLTEHYIHRTIEILDDACERLQQLKKIIEDNYYIANSTSDEQRRIEAQITLRGAMLLYENYARPLSSYIYQLSESKLRPLPTESSPKMAIGLEGQWISHELSRLLGSLNYLHNLGAVHRKLRQLDYRLERSQTRSHIFKNAQLYFYLEREEELKISQIHLASPGIIEFSVLTAQAGMFLVSILIFISQAPKFFDSIVTSWNKLKNSLREQRQHDREEYIEQEIHRYFMEDVLPLLRTNNSDLNPEAIMQLQQAIIEISHKKLVEPISATDQVLHSLTVLSHLYSVGKFQVLKERVNK